MGELSIDGSATGVTPEPATEVNRDALIEKSIVNDACPAVEESEPQYPSPAKLSLIMLGLGLSIFCVALDGTILGTAVPKITDTFHTITDVGWYASSYFLTTCAFQLFYGRLYTFFSIKWVYISALAIFEIGSIVCALAPSSRAFVSGRAIAGLGAGGVYSGAFIILGLCVPPHRLSFFMSLCMAVYGLACICSPLLGGVFTNTPKLSWRFCFWFNLPFGVLTLLFIILFFHPPSRGDSKLTTSEMLKRLDLPGIAVFLPAVVCLLLALQWGGTIHAWSSWRIVLLLVLASVLLLSFAIIQVMTGETATVPMHIIKQRNIWSSALFGLCFNSAFFEMLYYATIKGVSAVRSGVMNIPLIVSFVVLSVFSGSLTACVGYYAPFFYLSLLFLSIGSGLLTTLSPSSGPAAWISYQIVFGIGLGFGMQQPLVVVQTSLPLAEVPSGTAMLIFIQILGGTVFTSCTQNVFTNRLLQNLAVLVPDLNPRTVLDAGATELRRVVPTASYDAVIAAYSSALTTAFYVVVGLSCFSVVGAVFVPWVSLKKPRVPHGNQDSL